MNPNTALPILVVALVATGWIAPTLAATVTEDVHAQQEDAPEWDVIVQDDDDEEQVLFAAPSPGPNGDFATVVEGDDGAGTLELELAEIESGGRGINPGTRSDFGDVFRVENRLDGERTVSVAITSDDPSADLGALRDAVGFYAGGDPADTIDGDGAVSVAPGESVPIGLTIDLTDGALAGESFAFAFEFVVVGGDEQTATAADADSDAGADPDAESADDGERADDESADDGERANDESAADESADDGDDGSPDLTPTPTPTPDAAGGDAPASPEPTPATDPGESPSESDTPDATETPSDDGSGGTNSGLAGPFAFVTAAVVLVSALSTLLAWRNGIGR